MFASPLPGVIGWPLTGYVAVVLCARIALGRTGDLDRLFNRLGMWSLLALLLYRCAPARSLTDPVHQLALGCVIIVMMCCYAIVRAWRDGADPRTALRRYRICVGIGIGLTCVILFAGRCAGPRGAPVDLGPTGPGLVVALAYGIPLTLAGWFLIRAWIREFRLTETSFGGKFVCSGLIAANLIVSAVTTLSAVQLVTGWSRPDLGPQLVRIEMLATLCIFVTTTLAGIPVVITLITLAGLDRDGRVCRRLRPLWRDLTAAVPEIVLTPPADTRLDAEARLLRMTVEIRDALLHLGPYLPADTRPESDWHLADYARGLSYATKSRMAGLPPIAADDAPRSVPVAHDFDTELRLLTGLAKVWPGVGLNA
ncbi:MULTISPECIES: MAB_1171c family putative transporter [unclassified Nocardia]|uniref:MAB_1171c family putative transporter n=1 Tax=unclassified Nocardia TaxID=2637762 RepID=UPI001CE3C554|nr:MULTISPECIES: MAB_1171c family putative transporter [unclassified Nocardia]